jgi:hypothetical protein
LAPEGRRELTLAAARAGAGAALGAVAFFPATLPTPPFEEGRGFAASMGFHEPHQDYFSLRLLPARILEHRESLADARGGPEKDLEPPALSLGIFPRHPRQEGIGIRTAIGGGFQWNGDPPARMFELKLLIPWRLELQAPRFSRPVSLRIAPAAFPVAWLTRQARSEYRWID